MKAFLDSNLLVYLNTMTGEERKSIDKFFRKLLNETLFTNMLVLDETLYISKRKFKVPYETTLGFLREIVLPYTKVIPLDEEDVKSMEKYLTKHDLKPSDTLHLATMEKAGVTRIVTEDEDYDKVEEVRRIWLQ
ncbi:type II toxin-antitoxin system VapC family toxin [Candidatus Hecatella orcuttiae]|uniref:type II toxin-antitoxin system VapC family toxin n=1 Tax=Candidatus Hecatella orcuttiae TaxID=1935119 RepID=UPI002867B645|nr:type II toxin-antitoxin system VapC family toxin [Candidatus Hecatella orcuttiae]